MLPVVLIHGWASQPQVWQRLIDELPAVDWVNLSLPAYNSEGDWQQPAAYLLEQLPAHCHLVGWSLGGNLAMAIAAIAPDKVASVTTVATVPCFVATQQWPWAMSHTDFEQFSTGIKTASALTLKRFAALQAKGAANERDVLKALRKVSLSESQTVLIDSLQWLGETQQLSIWEELALPQQHLFGGGDALVPEAAASYCENAAVIADAGHAPMLSQPQGLAAALMQFWRGLT